MNMGYICSHEQCTEHCSGIHYAYYSDFQDGLVPITVQDTVYYIEASGFGIYYDQQLNRVCQEVTVSRGSATRHTSNIWDDPSDRPRKRLRLK